MITWMKNVNSFQIPKVHSQDVAKHLLVFCQFQSGGAYKSVAYKKACNSKLLSYGKLVCPRDKIDL